MATVIGRSAMPVSIAFLNSIYCRKTGMQNISAVIVAMLILAFVTVRLVVRIPVKYLVVGGTALGIAGVILLAHSFSVGMTTTNLIAGFILIVCGAGLVTSQLDNLTISFAKPRETNEASGSYNTFTSLV